VVPDGGNAEWFDLLALLLVSVSGEPLVVGFQGVGRWETTKKMKRMELSGWQLAKGK
jgi:hypothetical protein